MNYFRPCLVFDKMICKANQTLYEKLAGLFGKFYSRFVICNLFLILVMIFC